MHEAFRIGHGHHAALDSRAGDTAIEPKSAKNRLHLDLHVVDVAAAADRLTALGAQRVRRVDQFGIFWITMLDPEGNEFCVVPV